ncbi:MAG: hypothetical protein IPM42_05540 [Saprospiraceae bacterium]|nr:hypothetical protein [Saprospiraceae bacterium]
MKALLKIVSGEDRYSQSHRESLKTRLNTLNFNHEFKSLTSENEPGFVDREEVSLLNECASGILIDTVLKGKADVALVPLKKIPLKLPEGLIICGLSERDDPSDSLLLKSVNYLPEAILSILPGSKVGVPSELSKWQLSDLCPDVIPQVIKDELMTGMELINSGLLDALVFGTSELDLMEFDPNEFKLKSLHPREFIPACGQGVMAYVCHSEDMETRRIFKNVHQVKTSDCTNVERNVSKLAEREGNSVNVFCEADSNGNYHAVAVMVDPLTGKLKRGRVSQSTTLGLAENLLKSIN